MEKELEFKEIINIIQNHRQNAYRIINEELVTMYFEIGKYLSEKVKSEDWGSKAIDKLVLTIKSQYPYLKGFNRAGLYRMIQFYETYRDNIIVSPMVTQLSWTNNLLILQGTKTIEKKNFIYVFALKIIIRKENSKDKYKVIIMKDICFLTEML